MDETTVYKGTWRADAKLAAQSREGRGAICDTGDDLPTCVVERVTQAKRASNVVGHAIVRSGAMRVRFRLVNTADGLRLFPPANSYSAGGRTHFRKCAWVDGDVLARLEVEAVKLFERLLERDGRLPPQPVLAWNS